MLENFITVNWDAVAAALRTDNIIKFFTTVDPLTYLKSPQIVVPLGVLCIVLFLFKFYRTLALLVGTAALWAVIFRFMPKHGELEVHNVIVFGSVGMAVLAVWIYLFLLKSD